jgi:hypothetical protein
MRRRASVHLDLDLDAAKSIATRATDSLVSGTIKLALEQ